MRQRWQPWLLSKFNPAYEKHVAARKAALLGGLRGRVLEIGPGTGANLKFYGPEVEWSGAEPNRHMHAHLGLNRDLRPDRGEGLSWPGATFDAVVATLVLCSVRDVDAVLREVRRVLRPGGCFVFLEHVAAPAGTRTRLVQRAAAPLWALLADGCCPHRDTERAIREAGFASVECERFRVPFPVVGPHIAGRAW